MSFGESLNQPIVGVDWPESLVTLLLGCDFDRTMQQGVVFPPGLGKVEFVDSYRRVDDHEHDGDRETSNS